MALKKSKLDRELEKAAILLLKDAFRGNNRSRTAATTLSDSTNAAPPDPGPTLTERTKVFAAVAAFRQIQARIEPDDPDEPGTGTLADLQRKLSGEAGGGSTTPKANGRA